MESVCKKISGLLFSLAISGAPFLALAQAPLVPCGNAGQNPCTVCDFGTLIIRITNFLMKDIAIPVAGLMIVAGGLMIMLGTAPRVTAGKKILTNAVVGVVIVFIAWLLVDTIIKVLTGNNPLSGSPAHWLGSFGPWNSLPPCNF